jgi:hypothetical protein
MTGTDLRDLILSSEFKQGLEELSSYLASIMQERPIVHLLAKCLWLRKVKFELEYKKQDLTVNDKRIEFKFKFAYDRSCQKVRNRKTRAKSERPARQREGFPSASGGIDSLGPCLYDTPSRKTCSLSTRQTRRRNA